MKRQHNLDYLRGICAFGIMIYHYFVFSFGSFQSDHFMGRLGVYGVSIFYILSGLTLYLVYYKKMQPNFDDLKKFTFKRIFRIFPLLWLATFISIILDKKTFSFTDLILNLTGLFGFLKWDTYFSTGVWSIGNELVFYVFFPVFVYLSKKNKLIFTGFSILIFLIFLYFSNVVLNKNQNLGLQWHDYTNPLNQVFLFLGGFWIGILFEKTSINQFSVLVLLILSLIIFVFYPVQNDPINLVIGINRIIFTVCCFMICLCFFKIKINLNTLIHKFLTILGEASYSVYLLHALIYNIINKAFSYSRKHFFSFPEFGKIGLSIIITLILSYYVYQYFEKYFMRLGRKLTESNQFSTNQ